MRREAVCRRWHLEQQGLLTTRRNNAEGLSDDDDEALFSVQPQYRLRILRWPLRVG